jgi:hypothetical protein
MGSPGRWLLPLAARSEFRACRPAVRVARGTGRNLAWRRRARRGPHVFPSACRSCGVVLSDAERAYCSDCVPQFKAERTKKLVSAARLVLAEMREADCDPAQTVEAKAKRVATYVSRRKAARAWALENPGPHDLATYRAEILPRLARATVPQMVRATGLTSSYCWKIRRGERLPHPMYWDDLRDIRVAGNQ